MLKMLSGRSIRIQRDYSPRINPGVLDPKLFDKKERCGANIRWFIRNIGLAHVYRGLLLHRRIQKPERPWVGDSGSNSANHPIADSYFGEASGGKIKVPGPVYTE